jgi:hypothetical protein
MNPARTFSFALALTTGLLAACETPFAVAPEEPPAIASAHMGSKSLLRDLMFELTFDIDADGSWGRIMRVEVPVKPDLSRLDAGIQLLSSTVLRFLTPSGQAIVEIGPTVHPVDRSGFTKFGKDGIRVVADMTITDQAWKLLEDTKLATLMVEADVELLMEEEGRVDLLARTSGMAVHDMTNASLIKSPRDSYSDVDPVVWVSARQNPSTGALDHLVVIAFELWSTIHDVSMSQPGLFFLQIDGHFAVNGQRFIEQDIRTEPVVDAADYVFRPRNTLFDPATDPATGLPIVDVARTLIVRSALIPAATWKLVEAAMATGTVTVGMELELVIETPAGPIVIGSAFLAGLAEPRPDPAWLLELLS